MQQLVLKPALVAACYFTWLLNREIKANRKALEKGIMIPERINTL